MAKRAAPRSYSRKSDPVETVRRGAKVVEDTIRKAPKDVEAFVRGVTEGGKRIVGEAQSGLGKIRRHTRRGK